MKNRWSFMVNLILSPAFRNILTDYCTLGDALIGSAGGTITPPQPPIHSPSHLSHNTTRTASHPPACQSTQLSPTRRPSTSRPLPLPARTGKWRMSRAAGPKPPAQPSPPPCNTTDTPAGHPAGPWAGPDAPL